MTQVLSITYVLPVFWRICMRWHSMTGTECHMETVFFGKCYRNTYALIFFVRFINPPDTSVFLLQYQAEMTYCYLPVSLGCLRNAILKAPYFEALPILQPRIDLIWRHREESTSLRLQRTYVKNTRWEKFQTNRLWHEDGITKYGGW